MALPAATSLVTDQGQALPSLVGRSCIDEMRGVERQLGLDIRLLALEQMDLQSKEIATLTDT